jgi:hypothetical protein
VILPQNEIVGRGIERMYYSASTGVLYTNDPDVTVQVWAPNVTHVRLSNDSTFTDSSWQPYQTTVAWTLSVDGSYVTPRTVYVQFQGEGGAIYGTYMGDIIYDPVAPEGQVSILGGETVTVTLWLEAWDDNSGVGEMRVADTLEGIVLASWQPYTETLSWVPQGTRVYVQFQARAGNLSSIYDSYGIEHPLNPKYIYLPLVLR